MVGQNIGKYRVLDRIGRGGMGTVYRATDETLHRDVAIKVLNAELNDPEVAKRFRAEAITVARLSHPGIATIYELFQHDGQWLMVMEFVRGETLEHMVERLGALTPQRTAELCMQTLAALAHAHSMGVVHRDLKPANIMITESGAIKVMDFGIARVAGTEHLTSAGFMMGTPAYMAPEQVMGQEIDARADVYAMGVVFYRLTTGKLPFKGETPFAMAQSQVNDPPTPMGLFRSDLPAWVEQVVTRALAKNPDARFQSAVEFHEGFSRCLAGLPMSAAYNSSAPTELLSTPARAMPTGAIRQNPTTPNPIPPAPASQAGTGSHEAAGFESELEATMLSPSPSGRMPTGQGPAVSENVAPASGAMPITPPVEVPIVEVPIVAPAAVSAPPAPAPVAAAPAAAKVAAKTAAASTPSRTSSSTGLIAAAVALLVIGGGGAAWWMSHRSAAVPPVQDTAAVAPAAETPAEPPVEAPVEPPATEAAAPSSSTAATPSVPVRTPPRAATPPSAPVASNTAPVAPAPPAAAPPPAATPVAAAVEETPVTFADAKVLTINGRKADDVDVSVVFANGRLELLDKRTKAARGEMTYHAATGVTYSRGRDPKWDASLASPPQNLDVGGVLRTAKHWLVIQSHDAFFVLRLADSNWRKVLDTVNERVRPVTIATGNN